MHAMRRARFVPAKRISWGRGLSLALAASLIFLLEGDGVRALTANPGIDPLQILDLQVKPNVLFIIDTSGSMKWPVDTDWFSLGDDDPMSRGYQAKQAVNAVIQANASKMNFGLATYNQLDADKTLTRTTDFDGDADSDGPVLYVSKDANAVDWLGYFNNMSGTFPNYDGATSSEIFRSFSTITGGNVAAAYGYDIGYPPACTAGTTCRYYIQSRVYRDGVKYTWDRGIGGTGSLVGTPAAITCPLPPAGLTGFNPDADSNGFADGPRKCFQFQDQASGRITTYFYSSPLFQATSSAGSFCGGAAILNTVALCSADNSTAISAKMGAAAPVDGTGHVTGFPAATTTGDSTTDLTNSYNIPVAGLRFDQSTPLARSLDTIRTGTPAFPAIQAAGQKNFVILLSDGDDTCGRTSDQGVDQNAVDAAKAAQDLYDTFYGLNGKTQDFQHGAETMFIAFASAINLDRSNVIAQGGSGATINTAQPPASAATCPTGVTPAPTCRNAFSAGNLQQLIDALNQALNQVSSSGTFSDQQSITESIFENVNLVPRPSPSPPSPSPSPFEALDPNTRYETTVPILLQSIFEMPGYNGHLRAFRNVSGSSVLQWDAGDKLCERVTGYKAQRDAANLPIAPCDIGNATALVDSNAMGSGSSTFVQLTGPAGTTPNNIATSSAKIKRRIFTTTRNGVNSSYTPQNLVDATSTTNPATSSVQVALWPPDTCSTCVDPDKQGSSYPAGSVDGSLGIASLTFAQLQTTFGACLNSTSGGGSLPSDCGVTTGSPPRQLQLARKEAREIILAFTAGARVFLGGDGKPQRNASGDILYRARTWIMAESTLAAPGVVTPPLETNVSVHLTPEYTLFRDGPRNASSQSVNLINSGFGMRNPDDDNTPASKADAALKPAMSVVVHGTNHMLHAFRAGPQSFAGSPPTCTPSFGATVNECGGEELWAFVPYDQLAKLVARMQPQSRTNHTYVIAAPVRFSDVFVPGAFSKSFTGGSASGSGVWRTVLLVGRGAGGKSMTGLDVTVPGPFTTQSNKTRLPVAIWNRGNPDTNDGLVKTGSNSYNNNANDYNAYLKMGETWSVPAIGFATAAFNVTARKPAGVEFVAWMGSGYSDVSTEGTTFFALDVLTGDVIGSTSQAAHTLAAGTSAAAIPNSLVANISAFAVKPLSFNDPVNPNLSNPHTEKVTGVYFPDLHSRIWRFDPDTPATAPVLFKDVSSDGDQPVANGVALINMNSDSTSAKPHVFFEAGNDRRVAAPAASPFFRMYGYRDGGTAATISGFPIDFPLNFRGTVQPATAFNANGFGRVFFAGTKFNPAGTSCASSFDSVLFALQAADGGAAYDLNASGDDRSITLTGQRVNAIQVVGGKLVVDMGLGAQNPPPPPAPPVTMPPAPAASANVSVVANVPGTIPFKLGSSVCR